MENHEAIVHKFWELYEPIQNQLFCYLIAISKNAEMAKDIQQESLIIGMQKFNTLKNHQKFKEWLFKIAKHKAFRMLKQKKKELLSYKTDENIFDMNTNIIYNDDIEKLINRLNDERLVSSMLESLTFSERLIIKKIYYDDMTYSEVARELDITIGALRTRHCRIIKKIKECALK